MLFLVDSQGFSPERAYLALALNDGGTYESAEFLFCTERGEMIFVPTQRCLAVEASAYSQLWPNPRRGRRRTTHAAPQQLPG